MKLFKRYEYMITYANSFHLKETRYFNPNISQDTVGMLPSLRKAKKFVEKGLKDIYSGFIDTVIIEKVEQGIIPTTTLIGTEKWIYHIDEDAEGNPFYKDIEHKTSLDTFFYKDDLVQCYTRAIYLLRKSMNNYNNSVINGDEYAEVDYNYKRLRERLYDFCLIFLKLRNPEKHFTEDFMELNNKKVIEKISIVGSSNNVLLTLLSDINTNTEEI